MVAIGKFLESQKWSERKRGYIALELDVSQRNVYVYLKKANQNFPLKEGLESFNPEIIYSNLILS